ncbi:D-alanyl-D-alanine carboxypeptidase family protein [Fusobacterium russii]|uniref:D-alanyl-D-alanine carboxypeptidase family protein n=1 Tax=Fusobacterium russii TaxID=854 RepID=UPI0003A2A405|nr:D-alanyl-D-alanine carboxypeptidase family protein [Fusobacterium russii]
MLKKFYILLLFLLNISQISYSEIKEIITIEEYSKQFLNEDFVLDDTNEKRKEELIEETAVTENIVLPEEKFEKFEEEKIEQKTEEKELIEELIPEEKELEDKVEESVAEEVKEEADEKVEEITELKIEELIEEEEITEEKYKKELRETQKKEKKALEEDRNEKLKWEDLSDNFRSAIIADLNGNVYFSKNADKIYPLASVTKMMTLMVTFDEIKAGKISLKDKVKITKDVIHYGGSGIPLKVGQIYKLEDLVKASAIYSANNATYAIARYVGKGSVSAFVKMMNKKLEKLGLQKGIKYYTPAGLPTRMTKKPMDSGTARAIYKLSIEALKYKKYIEIAGIKNTSIYSGKIKIKNRNHLIGQEGIYGIKTGYHKEAKYNISVATKIDDMDFIVVVMGGESYTSRDKVVLDIIEIFKKNYYIANILDKNKEIGKVKVTDTNKKVSVVPDRDYKIALKDSQKYRVELKQRENIKLNIYKGEDLGEYAVYVDEKVVLKGRLLAKKAVSM